MQRIIAQVCINALGDDINEIQRNVFGNIEKNISENNSKYNKHENVFKDTVKKTNNLRNDMKELKECEYNNNSNMEKVYNFYESMIYFCTYVFLLFRCVRCLQTNCYFQFEI